MWKNRQQRNPNLEKRVWMNSQKRNPNLGKAVWKESKNESESRKRLMKIMMHYTLTAIVHH